MPPLSSHNLLFQGRCSHRSVLLHGHLNRLGIHLLLVRQEPSCYSCRTAAGVELETSRHYQEADCVGNFLNIFCTSVSSFFVVFSGLPIRSLTEVPFQIKFLDWVSRMLTTRVPTL